VTSDPSREALACTVSGCEQPPVATVRVSAGISERPFCGDDLATLVKNHAVAAVGPTVFVVSPIAPRRIIETASGPSRTGPALMPRLSHPALCPKCDLVFSVPCDAETLS
jgi:hypothetical protein